MICDDYEKRQGRHLCLIHLGEDATPFEIAAEKVKKYCFGDFSECPEMTLYSPHTTQSSSHIPQPSQQAKQSEQAQQPYDSRALKPACRIVNDFGLCTKCNKNPPCAAARTAINYIVKEYSSAPVESLPSRLSQ